MKLISLNIESDLHLDLIKPFITEQSPDVLCLQETPDFIQEFLHTLGYKTTFAPMVLRERGQGDFFEGIILASKHTYVAKTTYYHGSAEEVCVQAPQDVHTCSNPLVKAVVTIDNTNYDVATTHVMVTPDGLTRPYQITAITRLLKILSQQEPHVLCGDFNIPRGINDQYERFLESYQDMIPNLYGSSLDKDRHKAGRTPTHELNAPIFDTYMVDYIFTQPPYTASDVRLEFGVSDHAAVVATITRQ